MPLLLPDEKSTVEFLCYKVRPNGVAIARPMPVEQQLFSPCRDEVTYIHKSGIGKEFVTDPLGNVAVVRAILDVPLLVADRI